MWSINKYIETHFKGNPSQENPFDRNTQENPFDRNTFKYRTTVHSPWSSSGSLDENKDNKTDRGEDGTMLSQDT